LTACLRDLESSGQLVRIEREVDPRLEAAEIHRRVFQAGGPAIYYARVKGCRFPMASNLFGTMERVRYIFRDTLESVRRLVEYKADPERALKHPLQAARLLPTLAHMLPRKTSRGPVLEHVATVCELPQMQSWPDDGGAFITLPLVYTEHPD